MLARFPRDRYQTASELIVELERSRLAAPVPSFADPDEARQDPWVQACLASAEPTRLDPETPVQPAPVSVVPSDKVPPPIPNGWLLRFRTRSGRLCTVRTSAARIVQRLLAGSLPAGAEARRPGQDGFRPLSAFPEFKGVEPEEEEEEPEEEVPQARPGQFLLLALAAVGLLLTGLLLLLRTL
jgi:hypothetical protein